MIKIPLRIHVGALASKLGEWEVVNATAHQFANSRGLSRWLQVPGLLANILRAMTKEEPVSTYLLQEGWTQGGWPILLAKWLDEQVVAASPEVTLPVVLRENDRITTTVYRGVGLCFRRVVTRGVVQNILQSPTDDAVRWISSLMEKKGGGVIRLLPPDKRNPQDERPLDESGDDEVSAWTLEHHPWPDASDKWVEGEWAPGREQLAQALFPTQDPSGGRRRGRSVLLLGPPGVGKTETAVRACLLAHGSNARAFVVHGSVFARGRKGMTGRDAVSLIRALNACALIVDDMPPRATVSLLEEFEALYREQIPVAITLMTDGTRPRLPGFRPGRVDEVIEFSAPASEDRLALLRAFGGVHPAWEGMSKDSRVEGLTPAYLRELALRVLSGIDPEKALSSLAVQREIAT